MVRYRLDPESQESGVEKRTAELPTMWTRPVVGDISAIALNHFKALIAYGDLPRHYRGFTI